MHGMYGLVTRYHTCACRMPASQCSISSSLGHATQRPKYWVGLQENNLNVNMANFFEDYTIKKYKIASRILYGRCLVFTMAIDCITCFTITLERFNISILSDGVVYSPLDSHSAWSHRQTLNHLDSQWSFEKSLEYLIKSPVLSNCDSKI